MAQPSSSAVSSSPVVSSFVSSLSPTPTTPILPSPSQSSAEVSGTVETVIAASTASSSSAAPFFQTLQPTPNPQKSHLDALSKSILEWLFFSAALTVIAVIILLRIRRLRSTNRPLTHFFSLRTPRPSSMDGALLRPQTVPRTTGLPPPGGPVPVSLPPSLFYPFGRPSSTPAPAHGPARRTHGADVDASGRRGSAADDLPAYEWKGKDGPPGYVELEMDALRLRGVARVQMSSMGMGPSVNRQQRPSSIGRQAPPGMAGEAQRDEEGPVAPSGDAPAHEPVSGEHTRS